MKIFPKRRHMLFILPLLFFSINYHWSSDAMAWAVNDDPCPKALIEKSRLRLVPLFGAVTSFPIMNCYGQTDKQVIAPGNANFAPFLPTIMTIRFHGHNRDVIAHEYAHAELAARLGFFPRFLHIPIWFDEGLAMQVDHRADYNIPALKRYLANSNIKNNVLKNISGANGFFRQGVQGKYHYALSRCVVQKWLAASDTTQLQRLIKNIGWFGSFPYDQFKPHEKSCMARTKL